MITVPARRVKQFGVEFYQAGLSAKVSTGYEVPRSSATRRSDERAGEENPHEPVARQLGHAESGIGESEPPISGR